MNHLDWISLAPLFSTKFSLAGNTTVYLAFLIATLASTASCVFLWKSVFQLDRHEQSSRMWSPVFFLFGCLLVIAGLFLYWITDVYGRPAAIVHGIGVGLILAILLVGKYELGGIFSGQAAFFNISTLIVVAAATAMLVGINYLGLQKDEKFDFNKRKLESLDTATVNKLRSLEEPVDVLVFVTKQERNQVPQVKEFFEKYQAINRKMFRVRYINPLDDPELAGCYGVREGKTGELHAQVLITQGQCQKKGKDGGLEFKGKKMAIEQLKEEHVTNLMIRVSRKITKKICFLTGRGQPATEGNATPIGFHFLKKAVEDKGFKTMQVNLIDKDEVPKDCMMLINAAPEYLSIQKDTHAHVARLSEQEVDKVERYLDGGGKMMLFLEPRVTTGLETVLKKNFGIEWLPGLILEFRKNAGRPEIFFSSTFDKSHDITKGFDQDSVRTYFWYASGLKKASSLAGVTLTELVSTDEVKLRGVKVDKKTGQREQVTLSCCSFYIPEPYGMRFRYLQQEYVKIRPVLMAERAVTGFVEQIVPDAKRMTVALAMAVAKKSAKTNQETRLVVFADTFPASNRGLQFQGYGNVTLLINSIGWLAHEKDLVHLPPKNRTLKKLALNPVSRNTIQYTTRYAMPLFFFFVILLVMAIRKQQ